MISKKMQQLCESGSVIRAMFEEGKRLEKQFGAENVFDFSIGNPNLAAPDAVKSVGIDLLNTENTLALHGYMSNSGFDDVRSAVAQSLNARFSTNFSKKNIVMTVGAAGGLNTALKMLIDAGDEVVVFAPFFMEYKNYVENHSGVLKVVKANPPEFQPDFEALEELLSSKTRAVIINSPNNPTGVVYSGETLEKIALVLERAERRFKTDICLISDEPYRELVYDGIQVPFVSKFYEKTIICYSFSKSLSLPGERIGYMVIADALGDEAVAAASVATRILGFVNAPALQQKIIARCIDEKVNVEFYDRNRKALYNELVSLGFSCIKPQGAFYLFAKTPVDDVEFCEKAKEFNLLFVPGSTFMCSGYVRIAYCVSENTVKNSFGAFKKLAEYYGMKKQ